MAQFIDQLFCPNMRGLLIVKIRLREVAGSIPDELRFFIIIFTGGRGIDSRRAQIFYYYFQLYLSAVFYPLPYVKIGLREGRGIESRRAQIFLLFWDTVYVWIRLREGRGIDSRRAQIFYYFVLYRAAVSVCPTSSENIYTVPPVLKIGFLIPGFLGFLALWGARVRFPTS